MAGECATCPFRPVESILDQRGERWKAIHGDNRLALLRIEPDSIDAIITDPPYGTGANSIAGRLSSSVAKYSSSSNPMPAIAGDSMLPDEWNQMMTQVMAGCLRVAKDGASALIFCDWRNYPTLMRIVSLVGFGVRGLLVWDKGRGTRPSPNGFRAQSELILWARKGGAPKREPAVYLDGVFRHPSPKRNHHLTEKPVELMRDLVDICPPGGVVLDPFQGSGTTGVAALLSGRQYIGIEMVEHYHRVACDRLTDAEKEGMVKAVREGLYGG